MSDETLDLDAALAAVDRVVGRARQGQLSFDAGDPVDAAAVELRALLAEAEAGAGAERSAWEAASREIEAFFAEVHEDLAHLAAVRSGADHRTWVSWTGQTVTALAVGTPPAARAAHARAVRDAAQDRLRRLRLLAAVLAAGTRVAAMVSTPGGALLALPAAWRLIRSIHETVATITEPRLQGA